MENSNGVNDGNNMLLHEISVQIMSDLCQLPPPIPSENLIPQVHNELRGVNKKAYEPQFVAIGPYHHNNGKRSYLRYMEKQKLRYLDQMLKRRGQNNIDGLRKYVQKLSKIEAKARQQYAEEVNLTRKEFIRMMLLDGCFIIMFIYKALQRNESEDDPLLHVPWMESSIQRDLLLLENQLPFLVLEKLYKLIGNRQHNFSYLAWRFFTPQPTCSFQEYDYKYLLDLKYRIEIAKVLNLQCQEVMLMGTEVGKIENSLGSNSRYSMQSATELTEHGIKFKATINHNRFNITFNEGTLKIPTIQVDDHTEALFRNLVAYEQHCQGQVGEFKYVTDYVIFIDCLVNTSKDVKLLRQKKIIDNLLGDDEAVSTMFNKMGDNVSFNASNFYYARIFFKVNKHCEKKQNRWMATLRRDYFNTPWASFSFAAALILLIATIMQTVGTMLSIT